MGVSRVLVDRAMLALAAFGLACSSPAFATETVTYTYDARGRLVKVERAGTVNNNEITEYEHDRANNRKRVKTTGASS